MEKAVRKAGWNQAVSFQPEIIHIFGEQIDPAKMCYAFLKSKKFYHQEIGVMNPNPVVFDPAYVFPRDMYLFACNVDNSMLPTFQAVREAMQNGEDAPTVCIGSHRQETDRTIQLSFMPDVGCWIQALTKMSRKEIRQIIDDLSKEYKEIKE